MAFIHAVVVLKHLSGMPADDVLNTFNFVSATAGAPSSADLDACTANLIEFYNVPVASGQAVCKDISKTISRGAGHTRIRYFDVQAALGGGAIGSPIREDTFQLGVTNSIAPTPLPNELAIALSFHGQLSGILEFGPGGIRPKARRRGRVFIGPLVPDVGTFDAVTQHTIVAAAYVTGLKDIGQRLMGNVGPDWSVWSRKDAAFYPVDGGWVDNAFDVQRRRGEAPTIRTLYP